MTAVRKKREINKGRGDSRNKENLKKLELYLKLQSQTDSLQNDKK
jgi:hypothetical protein